MTTPAEEQKAWVRAVQAYLGVSLTELAKRAGLAPSTLQRPMNDPEWSNLLSGKTLAAVARAANLKPLEFPSRPSGMAEPEAIPFEYDSTASVEGNIDRAVRELCRGRNGRDPWIIQSYALELSGILPGDVMIVDLNMQPKPRDIVCAQVYEWSHMKAETVFRVYEPPYLVTNSLRYGTSKPMVVDQRTVIIRGVVDGLFRPRKQAAA